MSVFVEIALVAVVLLTWLIGAMTRSNSRLAGPDRAGAAIAYFLVTPFRWVALAVALGVALAEGGFAWIGGGQALQNVVVFLAHIAAGAASVILLVANSDRGAPRAVKLACIIVSYALPLIAAAWVAVAMHPALAETIDAAIVRAALLATLALGLVATAVAGLPELRRLRRRTRKRRAELGTRVADEPSRAAARMAELDRLGEDAALAAWLDFSGDNEPTAVQERALALIAARPGLHAELTVMLDGNRFHEALRYIRWRMDASPTVLAQPIRDALLRVAAAIRRRVEAMETPFPGQFELEVDQALALAERFHGPHADFRAALHATRDALDLVPGRKAAPTGRPRLDAWLATILT